MIHTISSIIRWMMFIPSFIFGMLLMIFVSFFKIEWLYAISLPICKVLSWTVGAKIRVEGQFPADENFVVMSNHSCFFDPFIFPYFMKGMYTGVVAEYNLKYPVWKQFLSRINAIPVNRQNRKKAIQSIKKAEEVLKKGFHIGILPEGTRTLTGKLGKLKKGGFHLAMNTKASIILVGINGAFKLKPKTTWKLTPCEIIVKVGKPIPFSNYESMGIDEILEKVEKELKILSGETQPEIS